MYFLGEDALHSGSLSPSADNVANELAGLSFEEQERQKEEWRTELAKVYNNNTTLNHLTGKLGQVPIQFNFSDNFFFFY